MRMHTCTHTPGVKGQLHVSGPPTPTKDKPQATSQASTPLDPAKDTNKTGSDFSGVKDRVQVIEEAEAALPPLVCDSCVCLPACATLSIICVVCTL
jgi:hypothetical protein